MISSIKLTNFRKFSSLKLDCNHKIIILTGVNASGKTSILESIYLTATSKSHRTNELGHLILQNTPYAKVEIKANNNYQVVLSKEGRTNSINGIAYPKLSDFIGRLNVVLFSPQDVDLLRGSKGIRRHFLDLQISLIDKSYLRLISEYKQLLKERNEILKQNNCDTSLLDILTKQLVEKMEPIIKKRISFLNELNIYLKEVSSVLECEEINLQYKPTYQMENILQSFSLKLDLDKLSKTTNIGVHRDDFLIEINGSDGRDFSSEGQTRTAVLAIYLALKQLYQKKNKDIILLLDDVFASMDQKRINHIMKYIKNEQQTWITTTSLFNIPDELLKDAKIIKL